MTDQQYTIEMQLTIIRRDIEEIHKALYGADGGGNGLIDEVHAIAETADRGRWALNVVLWVGGSIIGAMVGLAQLRLALIHLWG